MMEELFIGGPLDGQMKEVPPDKYVLAAMDDDFRTIYYVRGKIAGSSRSFPIWHPEELDGDTIIVGLMAVYAGRTVLFPTVHD